MTKPTPSLYLARRAPIPFRYVAGHQGNLIISRECSVTGKKYIVTVKHAEFDAWMSGTLVQDAFPTLSAEEREFLISNYTPAEWHATFGDEE